MSCPRALLLGLLLLSLPGCGARPPDPAIALGSFHGCPDDPGEAISVLGGVNKPQSLPMGPGLTFVRAIVLSGGLNLLAYRSHVRLQRCKLTVLLDFDRIVDGEAQDPPLEAGDILMVPIRD